VQSVTVGIDALGEVTIRLKHKNQIFSGHAANTDVIVASALAYMSALNRLSDSLQSGKALHPQHDEAQPVS
jgi:2-isopropylmalate synthase